MIPSLNASPEQWDVYTIRCKALDKAFQDRMSRDYSAMMQDIEADYALLDADAFAAKYGAGQ